MTLHRIKEFIRKRREKRKLRDMDDMWRMCGGDCFGLLPPSYYKTHTPEEVQEAYQKQIEKLKGMLREFEKKLE